MSQHMQGGIVEVEWCLLVAVGGLAVPHEYRTRSYFGPSSVTRNYEGAREDARRLVALSYCIDHWADAEMECHHSARNGPYCRFCGSVAYLEAWVTVGHPQRRDPYLRSIECSSCFGYECCNQVCPCCLQQDYKYKYVAALLQTCTTLRDVATTPGQPQAAYMAK